MGSAEKRGNGFFPWIATKLSFSPKTLLFCLPLCFVGFLVYLKEREGGETVSLAIKTKVCAHHNNIYWKKSSKVFLDLTNKSRLGITLKIDRSDVVALKELGYGESCRPIEFMHKREMAIRTKDLRKITKAELVKITEKIGGEIADFSVNETTEWAVVFTPLKNLKIYYLLQRYSPEFEDVILTFYSKETQNMGVPIDDLYDLTRLFANALVRSAKELTHYL